MTGWALDFIESPAPRQSIELKPGLLCVGRAMPGARLYGWLLLEDPTVSRHHFDLDWMPDRSFFKLRHISETNPTRVNQIEVSGEIPLTSECLIAVGQTVMRLVRREVRLPTGERKARHLLTSPDQDNFYLNRTKPRAISPLVEVAWNSERQHYEVISRGEFAEAKVVRLISENVWYCPVEKDSPVALALGDQLELRGKRYLFTAEMG
ncbi:MAG: FHA domain-containing protein [Vulcanimicrobiota bacterium]